MNEKLGNRMQSIDSGKWLPVGLIRKSTMQGTLSTYQEIQVD